MELSAFGLRLGGILFSKGSGLHIDFVWRVGNSKFFGKNRKKQKKKGDHPPPPGICQ